MKFLDCSSLKVLSLIQYIFWFLDIFSIWQLKESFTTTRGEFCNLFGVNCLMTWNDLQPMVHQVPILPIIPNAKWPKTCHNEHQLRIYGNGVPSNMTLWPWPCLAMVTHGFLGPIAGLNSNETLHPKVAYDDAVTVDSHYPYVGQALEFWRWWNGEMRII